MVDANIYPIYCECGFEISWIPEVPNYLQVGLNCRYLRRYL